MNIVQESQSEEIREEIMKNLILNEGCRDITGYPLL